MDHQQALNKVKMDAENRKKKAEKLRYEEELSLKKEANKIAARSTLIALGALVLAAISLAFSIFAIFK